MQVQIILIDTASKRMAADSNNDDARSFAEGSTGCPRSTPLAASTMNQVLSHAARRAV
jgi:hypothetical protein